jgi:hypothetical protein
MGDPDFTFEESFMSAVAENIPASTGSIEYQYNKLGNVRARRDPTASFEILLDVKLVPQSHATTEYLASLGGAVAEARDAGFTLGFAPAGQLGIETLNEMTGQWRPVPSTTIFAVTASL